MGEKGTEDEVEVMVAGEPWGVEAGRENGGHWMHS